MCVCLVKEGNKKADQCQVFSIPDLGSAGAPQFWSLAHKSITDLSSDFGVDFEYESSASESSDGGEDSEMPGESRPRVDDPRRLGNEIVLFVRDHISAYGQTSTGARFLAAKGFVFGAPLRQIAEAACEHCK